MAIRASRHCEIRGEDSENKSKSILASLGCEGYAIMTCTVVK